MAVTDPIADMLTRIRNATRARHDAVEVPLSRMKREVARVLQEEGYIAEIVEVSTDTPQKLMRLTLRYQNNRGVISGIKRISRPGLRVYVGKREIPRVLGGLGIAILSTSHGIMADRKARRSGLGGELLCYVW